jgi:hypothetical protein
MTKWVKYNPPAVKNGILTERRRLYGRERLEAINSRTSEFRWTAHQNRIDADVAWFGLFGSLSRAAFTRWGLYPQAALVALGLIWWQYQPDGWIQGPGVAIGFLGVAAAIMAARADHASKGENFAWVLIAFALFFVEMHYVRKDRDEHDAQQSELRIREDTARQAEQKAFSEEEAAFKKTAEAFDGLFRQNKELFNETSGGDSYLYFDIGNVGVADVELQGIKKREVLVTAFPVFVGKYPLTVVYVSTWCTAAGWLPIAKYDMMRPNQIGRSTYAPTLRFLNDPARKSRCVMSMNAPNGDMSQDVWVMKGKDDWVWTSRLFKQNKVLKVFSGPGFPTKQLSPKWYGQDVVPTQP